MEQLLNKGHSWKGLVLENLEIVSSVIRRQPPSPLCQAAAFERCRGSPGAPCLQMLPLHGHGEPLEKCPMKAWLVGQPNAECFENLAVDFRAT